MNVNRIQERMYAVSVRHGQDILLFLSICRGTKGDVCVNFPREDKPRWKPHSTYHASGQHHQRSFGHNAIVQHGQKPDANFRNTANVVATGIASDDPRATNALCQTADFQEVFEILIGELRPEKYRTSLSVDITEANGKQITEPETKVLLQAIFQDIVPWILVTLFDTDTNKASA